MNLMANYFLLTSQLISTELGITSSLLNLLAVHNRREEIDPGMSEPITDNE